MTSKLTHIDADGAARMVDVSAKAETKREAVELGLRTLVALRRQADIRRFRGRLMWEGDLEAMRTDG